MNFTGAALARSDPAALDRVVAKAQTPDAPLDETNIAFAFGNELSRAPLPIPDGSAPISLSAGVMKVGPIRIPGRRGDGALSADLDLRKLAAETRLTLTSSASDLKFWSGPPPSATVTVDNALEAPKRQLDVSSLSAGLAAQAIARETDRIATMEADIRERAFFNRRLKGERFMDRRQQEIEDWRSRAGAAEGAKPSTCAPRRKRRRRPKPKRRRRRPRQAAAEKAAAEKAAADKARGRRRSGETPKAAAGNAKRQRRRSTPAGDAPRSDEVGADRARAGGADERRTGPKARPPPKPTGEAEGALY